MKDCMCLALLFCIVLYLIASWVTHYYFFTLCMLLERRYQIHCNTCLKGCYSFLFQSLRSNFSTQASKVQRKKNKISGFKNKIITTDLHCSDLPVKKFSF